jgi:hypothetical protein
MASHSILSMIGEGGEPRRTARRKRVMLVARLSTSTAEFPVTIRDISSTGARVEARDLPSRDSVVMLKRGTFTVYGRLTWTGEGAGGVAFDEPFDDDELMEALKGMTGAQPQPETPYRRPGFTHGSDHAPYSDGGGWIDEASLRARS